MTTYMLQQNTLSTTVGYSTKPQNVINNEMARRQNLQAFTSSAMVVAGGIGDDAVDVTYSKKSSNQIQTANYSVGWFILYNGFRSKNHNNNNNY